MDVFIDFNFEQREKSSFQLDFSNYVEIVKRH